MAKKRLCEFCETWMTQTECQQRGAPTRKQEATRGRDSHLTSCPSDTEPDSSLRDSTT